MTIRFQTAALRLPVFTATPQPQLTSARPASPAASTKASELAPETQAVLAKLGEQAEAARALAKSMSTSIKQARDEARAAVKNQARAHLERLNEEYKLIRKLWAHDPAEMARQLGRVAKELKRAVADYAAAAKANGERMAALGPDPAAEAAPAGAAGVAEPQKSEGGETQTADAAAKPEQTEAQDEPGALPAKFELTPKAELADAIAAYTRLAPADPTQLTPEERRQEIESAEGEARSDLEFARDVKGFIKKLREELTAAKIRASALKDDATREAFEETEKTFAELDEDIGDMEADIDAAFPDLDISASPANAA